MCTDRLDVEAPDTLSLDGPFELESGAVLASVRVAYRTWGRLTPAADNAVVVCHALTGSADADLWWGDLIGPGRALDPEQDFVICSNVLGSCYGTTGPTALAPRAGNRWGADFPAVTVRDMVELQRRLLDTLGVARIRLVIGGSLGGMQTLEWLFLDERVEAAVVIAASARHSAWCIAQSESQRAAIAADPRWCGGRYDPNRPPEAGLSAARMMAMCSYRSPASFENRFGRAADGHDGFRVSSWLSYHGGELVARFDANSYVCLTHAMDSHDVGRGRGGIARSLGTVRVPTLVVSIDSDGLYPPAEQRELARLIPEAELHTLRSQHGHDGFLIETDQLDHRVRTFREDVANHKVVPLCAGGAA
jgi:homoserine O-acetyltransferase